MQPRYRMLFAIIAEPFQSPCSINSTYCHAANSVIAVCLLRNTSSRPSSSSYFLTLLPRNVDFNAGHASFSNCSCVLYLADSYLRAARVSIFVNGLKQNIVYANVSPQSVIPYIHMPMFLKKNIGPHIFSIATLQLITCRLPCCLSFFFKNNNLPCYWCCHDPARAHAASWLWNYPFCQNNATIHAAICF